MGSRTWAFQITHYWTSNSKIAEIRHLGSWRQNAKVQFSQKLSNLELWWLLTPIGSRTWAFQRTHYWTPKNQDRHLANSMSWSQGYVSHCRVLPLGKFTVMIAVPHVSLRGAVTWRNQCNILQGIRIPSAMLKIVFRHIFFVFLM